MSNNTILDKLNYNTTILNISNQNITGVLNLEKFSQLRELYCSNNKITKIINISTSLEYFVQIIKYHL